MLFSTEIRHDLCLAQPPSQQLRGLVLLRCLLETAQKQVVLTTYQPAYDNVPSCPLHVLTSELMSAALNASVLA